MKHEQPSRKRQTIRIKLPPKPAAPRHPQVFARAIRLDNVAPQSQTKPGCFLFPLIQVTVASVLSILVLDFGECSRLIAYAVLGYVGGLAVIVPRRHALTPVDEFLVRWGFVFLCILFGLLAAVLWLLHLSAT